MHRRIIIGRNDQSYYYTVSSKESGKWAVIEYHNDDVGKDIKKLLDVDIDNLRLWNNLLLVKTNDDLVVIDNYSQINHDMVFKSFNRKVSKMTINNDLLHKKLSIQKVSPYKKANISARVVCTAALAGILIMPTSAFSFLGTNATVYAPTTQLEQSVTDVVKPSVATTSVQDEQEDLQKEMMELKKHAREVERERIAKEAAAREAARQEAEYFNGKVQEYSSIYGIDYNRALNIARSHESEIKNNFPNQELGILTFISEAYYNDGSIDKSPRRSNISSMEREKLLLKYAKVYGITDANTVTTMLAIYRLETGNGSSPASVNQNNFGGLKTKSQNDGYETMSFKTPEIGAVAMVDTFLSIKDRTVNSDHYNPSRSLEDNLNVIYCGEATWPGKVREIKASVRGDYNINQYVEEAKAKQLTKK